MGVSVIVLALSCIAGVAIADTVPVVMWGPLSKSSPVLNENAQENFIDNVVTSPFTLAFVEDKLASEDLSLCKSGSVDSCFPYLSSVQPKAYYAQVSRPAAILGDLSEDVFYAYVDKDGNLESEIPVKGTSVVIVMLQEDTELDRAANLKKHDGYIKKIYNDIASKLGSKKVLALYTGKSSTSLVRKARQAQTTAATTASTAAVVSSTTAAAASSTAKPTATTSAPATGNEPGMTFASPEFLVHLSSISFTDTNQGKSALEISGMSITNKTATSFDVSMPTNADTVKFTVVNSAGYWNVQNLEYGNYDSFVTIHTVGAADGFSYYCGPATTYTIQNGPTLTLTGLQIEPNFTNSTKADTVMSRFNDPYNCVGFTSIPIWTGLFITFMMLFILSIGITWMMDINTMDRFDDPKGKTIIISASD